MNKEENKNKIIQELSEENDNLRAVVEYQKQIIEGLQMYADESVAQYPVEVRKSIAECEEAKEKYNEMYKECIRIKKELETEYRQKLEDVLASVTTK